MDPQDPEPPHQVTGSDGGAPAPAEGEAVTATPAEASLEAEHPPAPTPELAPESEAPGSDGGLPPEAHPEPAEPPPPPLPTVAGTIKAIGDEEAQVELEDGRTAVMRKLDLADAQGKIHAQIGDRVEALLEERDGSIRLLRRRSPRAEALEALADVFARKVPVEGRIVHAIKGGFEVRVLALRAFCPSSQLSVRRDDLPGDPVGQVVPFLVTKYDAEGKSLVVSRRKLLERDQKKQASETRDRLKAGARLMARVVSLQPYGAFMDLGGLQGLLHVSEMSHARISGPEDVLQIGQEVEVVVLKHDEGYKKISLSLKALVEDPWSEAGKHLAVRQVHRGVVKRVLDFGAFVEIAPGVEGLLPHAGPPGDGTLAPDTELLVLIADLDVRRHRLSLAHAPEGRQAGDVVEPPVVEPGATIDGTVERVVPFGVFVRLLPRRTGLLHASETATPPGTDLAQAFPVGSRVSVEILDVSEDGQRIRLTRRAPEDRAAAAQQRMQRPRPPASEGAPTGAPMSMGPGERERDRRPRSEPRRDAAGPRSRERTPDRGGDRGERHDRSERGGGRGPRDRGPRESLHNPAAAPRSSFASFGDVLRKKLGLPEPEAPPPREPREPREPRKPAREPRADEPTAEALPSDPGLSPDVPVDAAPAAAPAPPPREPDADDAPMESAPDGENAQD
jgi:small subunit ribosomal protein S1